MNSIDRSGDRQHMAGPPSGANPTQASPLDADPGLLPMFRRLHYVADMMRAAAPAAGPRLLWMEAGGAVRQIHIAPDCRIEIGRDPATDVPLDDSRLSRRHFRVTSGDSGCEIFDLKSRNGTHVNGRRIGRDCLRDGDVIEAGRQAFVFLLK